jgi:hypothetical protein
LNASITEFLKAIGWVLVIKSVVIVEQLLSGCDFPCCVEENADGAIDAKNKNIKTNQKKGSNRHMSSIQSFLEVLLNV